MCVKQTVRRHFMDIVSLIPLYNYTIMEFLSEFIWLNSVATE